LEKNQIVADLMKSVCHVMAAKANPEQTKRQMDAMDRLLQQASDFLAQGGSAEELASICAGQKEGCGICRCG